MYSQSWNFLGTNYSAIRTCSLMALSGGLISAVYHFVMQSPKPSPLLLWRASPTLGRFCSGEFGSFKHGKGEPFFSYTITQMIYALEQHIKGPSLFNRFIPSLGMNKPTVWYSTVYSGTLCILPMNSSFGNWLYYRETDKIMKSPLICRKPYQSIYKKYCIPL